MIDENFRVKYVAVLPYGSYGTTPLNPTSCRFVGETGDSCSCMSGSGLSICGYFAGHVSDDVIQCRQDDE